MKHDSGRLYRLAAFADAPGGGNPAGVWVGDALPEPAGMQRIAADVGYSETAFLAPTDGRRRTIRYYSPQAEVTFCGHATIASGVVLGRHDGAGGYELDSAAGAISLDVRDQDGAWLVTLRSVEPRAKAVSDTLLQEILATFGWTSDVLDDVIRPAMAFAGAWHMVLPLRERTTLAGLDYDFEALRSLMLRENLTTMQVVYRESSELFHSRNPFPVGGVVEDAATGASAAALGGYLRSSGHIRVPSRFTILQGHDMGRPSRLLVDVPAAGGILVTGSAVDIDG